MSRATVLLAGVLLVAGGFVVAQGVATQRRASARRAGARADAATARADSAGTVAALAALRGMQRAEGTDPSGWRVPGWVQEVQARHMARPLAAPERDATADAERFRRYAGAGYLAAVAATGGGRLVRWPDRDAPLRVWVQPEPGVAGFGPALVDLVRGTLRTWDGAGLPFGVVAERDSTAADVFVLWREGTHSPRIGETLRITDANDWIIGAVVTIALHDATGAPLDVYTVQNAARHEMGHALGLEHSPDAGDIMAPTAARQPRLSDADLSTVRLLYALPPGPLP